MVKHEAQVERSAGAKLVEMVERWIGSFIYFPNSDAALVCALWAVGSWSYQVFWSWPFLAITATVKGAGKSTLLEVLSLIVRSGKVEYSVRPGTFLGTIAEYEGKLTMLIDEAEGSSSEAKSFMSEVMNAAYKRGGMVRRKVGKTLSEYQVYCPIALALIGDPSSTVRSRSVVVTLTRGKAARDFFLGEAAPEGEMITKEIKAVLDDSSRMAKPEALRPDFLQTRDRELWGSLLGLAAWLKLDREQIDRLERFASDNSGEKVAPKRAAYTVESEDEAVNSQFAVKALTDLLAVLETQAQGMSEKRRRFAALSSAEAVEKMKAIPTAPWRTFKGEGLTQFSLAALVSRFGVSTKQVARKVNGVETNLMGYKLPLVEAAAKLANV